MCRTCNWPYVRHGKKWPLDMAILDNMSPLVNRTLLCYNTIFSWGTLSLWYKWAVTWITRGTALLQPQCDLRGVTGPSFHKPQLSPTCTGGRCMDVRVISSLMMHTWPAPSREGLSPHYKPILANYHLLTVLNDTWARRDVAFACSLPLIQIKRLSTGY